MTGVVMNDLIEALQILSKYGNPMYPTHCEHDTLIINPDIQPSMVSIEDRLRLDELGFFITSRGGEELFASFIFGSL
jgi:hypothetical protein